MKLVRALVLGGSLVAALGAAPAHAQTATVPACDTVQTLAQSIGVTVGVTLDCSAGSGVTGEVTVPCDLLATVLATVPCS